MVIIVDPVEINVPKMKYVEIQFVNQNQNQNQNQNHNPNQIQLYYVRILRLYATTSVLTNGVTIKIAEFAEMYVLLINSVITEAVSAILLKLHVMINVTH
jgi:hypothetical protein